MSYNMLDMELDYEDQIKYFESEVKRLKAKCNRLIRENRELKNNMSKQTIPNPVNVYGTTQYYEDGLLESIHDGFGYRDTDGNITWYGGYEPIDDEFHESFIYPYGNGCDLKEVQK